jgi:hypothetical protein
VANHAGALDNGRSGSKKTIRLTSNTSMMFLNAIWTDRLKDPAGPCLCGVDTRLLTPQQVVLIDTGYRLNPDHKAVLPEPSIRKLLSSMPASRITREESPGS